MIVAWLERWTLWSSGMSLAPGWVSIKWFLATWMGLQTGKLSQYITSQESHSAFHPFGVGKLSFTLPDWTFQVGCVRLCWVAGNTATFISHGNVLCVVVIVAVELLFNAGVQVDVIDSDNNTALHHACSHVSHLTTMDYIVHCVRKKHPKHYWLSREEEITNVNDFQYNYFWHNWPSNKRLIFHFTQCLLLHYLGKTEPTKYGLKWTEIHQKAFPQHYRLWHEEGLTDFNNFWCKHISYYLPSNDRSSFHLIKCLLCTTWKTTNRQNRIKMQYFVGFVFPGSAETNNKIGAVENWTII